MMNMNGFTSFSMGPGGSMMMMGGPDPRNLPCSPGEDFTEYVRKHLKPFPPCSPYHAGSSRERLTLWPGRRLECTTTTTVNSDDGTKKEMKQVVKVVQWIEYVTGFACPEPIGG